MVQSLSKRKDYPCLSENTYLNQASLGLISEGSVRSMHKFLDDTGRHGNLNMSDSEEASFLEPLRANGSKLIDCNPDNLAITSSASEILNQLPYLFEPRSGSKILMVSTDFPALTRPWIAYCQKANCEIKFIDESADKNLTEQLIANLDANTAAVCVSYVQFSTGTLINVKRLRETTNKIGAKLIIDITQAAGALPIHFNDWMPDVIVCSGYKWLGGHGGVAISFISSELLKKTPPSPGWFGAKNPFDMNAKILSMAENARRYTQATMSYISVVGLNKSILELLELKPVEIRNHAQSLSENLFLGLKNSDWTPYRAPSDKEASSHIISLSHQNAASSLVLQKLKSKKVVCSERNDRIRISLAHYNNEQDIDNLLNVLKSG